MPSYRSFIATHIIASRRNGTIYTGSTVNLVQRVWQNRNGSFEGVTDSHGCHLLVWFERHGAITEAIRRERRIKKWLRDWKLALIERENPEWLDLAADWFAEPDPNWTPPKEP